MGKKVGRFFMDDLIFSPESSEESVVLGMEIYKKEKESFFLLDSIPAHWVLETSLKIFMPQHNNNNNIELERIWFLASEEEKVTSFLPLSGVEQKSLMTFMLERYLEGEINLSLVREKIIEIGRSRKK